jgi:hypothetical protein
MNSFSKVFIIPKKKAQSIKSLIPHNKFFKDAKINKICINYTGPQIS